MFGIDKGRNELNTKNLKTNNEPNVIILGAGAAGIAAASKLFQNGFKNVKILEAENRIGGRVYTTKFGEYLVDIGGQWVNGEEENVVFELAWPLGLLEKGRGMLSNTVEEIFDSSGNIVDKSDADDLIQFDMEVERKLKEYVKKNENSAIGLHYKNELDKYIEAHPKWKNNKNGLTQVYNMMTTFQHSAENWDDISTLGYREFKTSPGDYLINWKENGYKTILDILMKRLPKPDEELPVMSNTVLNAEVNLIDYSDPNGKVEVKTTNGKIYSADHVIVTFSVGALKEIYKSLFKPALSEGKRKAIEGMDYGNVAKILFYFDEPWWPIDRVNAEYSLIWNDIDLKILQKDDEKSWLQGLVGFYPVEHKPKLLSGWVCGKFARDVEKLTDEQVKNHCIEVLHRFFGKTYNVTNPTKMMRSMWHTNKHFRGTNSYRSPKADPKISNHAKLAKPIGKGKPVVLFAGEATNPRHFSSVHGAIETGWREADRIIQFYPNLAKN